MSADIRNLHQPKRKRKTEKNGIRTLLQKFQVVNGRAIIQSQFMRRLRHFNVL